MSNEIIKVFENEKYGKIRIIDDENNIWFVAKDIALILGYKRPDNAIRTLVDDEDKLMHQISASGQKRNMYLINESGLYTLILSSRLPSAKGFKRWVTCEVLPSIRKNGGYINGQENMKEEELMASALMVAKRVLEEKEKEIERLKPKGEYYDNLVDYNLCMNIRNTAKEIGIGQNEFISFLLEKKYLYRDKKGVLLPYAKYRIYFELREWYDPVINKGGYQTFITPNGRMHFMNILKNNNWR